MPYLHLKLFKWIAEDTHAEEAMGNVLHDIVLCGPLFYVETDCRLFGPILFLLSSCIVVLFLIMLALRILIYEEKKLR